jgi:hypothetical protein
MMPLKSLAAAAALLASGWACAVTLATVNAGAYSITYDSAAASDFVLSHVTSTGFEWSFKDVQVQSFAAGAVSKELVLPDFTVTANAGWNLGSSLSSTAGNVVFFEFGPSASTSLTAGGTLSVLNGSTYVLPQTPLLKSSGGYFYGSSSAPLGDATGFTVTNASLVLTATAGANSFAAITGQSQNNVAYAFTAQAVPEPETYALLMAGLGLIGLLARRRRA